MATLDQKTIGELRKRCKDSLFFLARAVLGLHDLTKEIHRPICKTLESYENNTRVAIVLPRTWFKSSITSFAYPIWRAIKNPDVRILIAQNSMTNAKKKVQAIKMTFDTNELLQVLFPEILPKGDRPWSAECLTLNRKLASPEGTFEPAGTGTAVISRHYDVIIEDDTVAPDFDQMTGDIQQPTQIEIEKAIGWHKLCHPLLIHPTKSQIVVVGTRWAPEDLLGWLFSHGPGYEIISRSALEKPGYPGVPATVDQGGVPVWERFNSEVLEELEFSMGILMFHMLYLNIASSAINQVFKREHIRYYEKMSGNLIYCTSVDPAPTDKAASNIDSDFNVVLTTALNPATGQVYIVHYDRDRVDPGELVEFIFNHHRAYNPDVVYIESVAYQKTLMYWVRRRQSELNEMFYIEEVKNARISKNARILGLQPWFDDDRVAMKKEHADLERELLAFDPARKGGTGKDDVIDALSMHVKFWSDMCKKHKAIAEQDKATDIFSGQTVINELLERVKVPHQYPYDIGLMNERVPEQPYYADYEETYSHNYVDVFNN